MFRVFPKFDPRLKADLWKQRTPILLGLACTVATAALTAATIPAIEHAVRAIQNASPIKLPVNLNPLSQGQSDLQPLAQELKLPVAEVEAAVARAKAKSQPTENKGESEKRQTDALKELSLWAIAVVVIYGLKYWFTRGSVTSISKASVLLANDLRLRIFDRLMRLPIAYFNKKRAGAVQSVLTNDTTVYLNAVNVLKDSIDGPLKIVTGLVAVVFIQPLLALAALLFVPLIATIVQINAKKMKEATGWVQNDLAELQAFTQEMVQGTRVVKAFGAESRIATAYRKLIDQYFRSQMRYVRRFASLKPLIEFVGAMALAVIVYLCGWLAFRSQLDIAKVTALIYALDMVNQGWRALGYVRSTFATVEAATDRIYNEVMDVPLEVDASGDAQVLASPQGRIEFQNVSFTYPDGTEALRKVNFTIEPGTSLALVGPSGAGKSTIADILLRFYDPSEGRVLMDGVDIRQLRVDWYRKQIGVVPQQTFLFAGTVAENIRVGAEEASDSEVEAAAKAAHADVFVERLPERYDSELGEQGIGLSGGERQRVAIARALVRKPAVLLLDEATSNLDAESEKAVTEALAEIMTERTTLFIAHRLTTAARADQILVLRRGEVLEQGSHKDLMAKNASYAVMYRAFGAGLLDEAMG